jgi:MerR family regulatory protein
MGAMTRSEIDWPAPDTPGLRIGDAAALMQITPKAIRVYHEYGLLPEPERDASGYRRWISLRAIRPVLVAHDVRAALSPTARRLPATRRDR